MTVLIVNSDGDVRRRLKRILTWRTWSGGTEEQGLKMGAKRQPPIVLLAEWLACGSPAVNLIPAFRRQARRAKVVILSSAWDRGAGQRAVDAGAFAYVESGNERRLRATLLVARAYYVSTQFVDP